MDNASPPPLEYATPRYTRRQWGMGALLLWVFISASWIAFCFLVVPRFVGIFRDFGMKLHWATELLLVTADWITAGFGWIAVALLPCLVPLTATRRPVDETATPHGRWFCLTLGMLVLAVSIMWWFGGLVAPLMSLMGAVSGNKR